jgi:hypothetical protein
MVHRHASLCCSFFRGLFFIMPVTEPKFYLHVVNVNETVRCPFSSLTLDQLRPLVGDRSGNCYVGISRSYFRGNPIFVIAADDNFGSKDWPYTAIINDRWFRGAIVILAERPVDPDSKPFQGETVLDGLTAEECKEASRWISAGPGADRPKFPYPPRSGSRY